MTEGQSPAQAPGEPLCEMCAQPMPSGARPLLLGACQFPFHVHDACQEHLAPLAAEITQMCSAAEEQPEGLLWLGSWEPVPTESEIDR